MFKMISETKRNPVIERKVLSSKDTIQNSENITAKKWFTKIERHPDFARWERPLGLKQHMFNAVLFTFSHLAAFLALFLTLFGSIPSSTLWFDFVFVYFGGFGTTIGAHRYWSHRTFKANKPLQVILMIMQTVSGQYPIHKWCLEHRVHHKYTDTDADPHNSKRGLFFSHMGWLYVPKHPECQNKLDTFDMSDLENDSIVRFQSRWYWTLVAIFHTAIPVSILYYFWKLPLLYCFIINLRRYVFELHTAFIVNSLAHRFGDKPYDKSICAAENSFVSLWAVGEGWHNYHHTFPWDYKTSEYGWKLNPSTMLIDSFAWMGWVTNMKTVSPKLLEDRIRRTGDVSRVDSCGQGNSNESRGRMMTTKDLTEDLEFPLWGWGDEKMPEVFKEVTKVVKSK